MRNLSNSKAYQEAQAYSAGDGLKLPVGNYKIKILDVKYEDNSGKKSAKGTQISDSINIRFDIAEGEFKDYYQQKYDFAAQNHPDDAKWKGTFRIYVPRDDGTEEDGWTMRSFKTATTALEDSNKGYVWDWDENKWKGLVVGLQYREDAYNGNIYAAPYGFISVDDIAKAKTPKPTKRAEEARVGANTTVTSGDEFMSVPDTGSDKIPF
jgi:hypothetical protein